MGDSMPNSVRLYVVLDTNIWRSTLGLATRSAAIVRFFLNRKNAKIAVPEVVSLELQQVLGKTLREVSKRMSTDHGILLSVFGSLTEVSLPSHEEIDARVASLLGDTDVPNIVVPFTLRAAKATLLRMINRTSPCRSGEQFRDGIIWENCLELLNEADVYLVTGDRAFYKKGTDAKDHAIAPDLLDELDRYEKTFRLFKNLDELLREIQSDVTIDDKILSETVFDAERSEIDDALGSTGFQLSGAPQAEITPFFTEVATQLYFRFEIHQPCVDVTPEGRQTEGLTLKGEGFFDTATNTINQLHVSSLRLRYSDTDGEVKNRGSVRVRGSVRARGGTLWGGARRTEYTLRLPVEIEQDD